MVVATPHERAPGFEDLGILALTTTRQAGSFNLGATEPVSSVFGRWWTLLRQLSPFAPRLACALQVHGPRVLEHEGEWTGWLRASDADGHIALDIPTAMAVTLADCVPVFIGHAAGGAAILHAGWRGTEAGIVQSALSLLARRGVDAADLTVHLGPAICGRCYEVGPDVYYRLTGSTVEEATTVDIRAILRDQLQTGGVRRVTISECCTRCNNDRFFSHRVGDDGRQLGVIVSRARLP
jgi:hypothetical protein